ncbi:GHKL domain-containing protein [Mucilaginibacter sp. UR6-1]|uniref:ATP-binding protein n=1 Tax=Mucilaginibacter sp. UR6-1 TaxID=1435643 RepID=UPI001E4E30C2|nr:ATP-binding protein [Mucilaginibacter sp. UR6-1]MCC8407420.1 GHKL domain-containing protein [Mucilaginibacter sp. UR6-1]
MHTITVDLLKHNENLQNVPDEQLQWLIDQSHVEEFEPGDRLFEAGSPLNFTLIILQGSFRVCMVQGGSIREVAMLSEGSITGYLPYSRGKKVIGYGECVKKMTALMCPAEKMQEAIKLHYELTEALVHIMTNRVRDFTALQQQNEKMMALGKLSAGLAHELNNPAAAIVRNTSALKDQLKQHPHIFKEIAAIKLKMSEVDPINVFIQEIINRPDKPVLSMLEKSAKEDEIMDWLEDHEVNSYEMAETLVDVGFTVADLDKLRDQVAVDCVSPVLVWINNTLMTDKLVTDIEEASRRISELVTSVKNFTHMDMAADKQPVDIKEGIISTLKMMIYKIKKNNIHLEKSFADDLPKINARPGDLNQVWTNLIDNALDAMESNNGNVLKISTRRDGAFLQVKITDSGPGIPEEIRSRIFDPFFTTKAMGKGTGMGLDVVNRIIQQHNGTVKVKSKPGETEFEVCLPLNQE